MVFWHDDFAIKSRRARHRWANSGIGVMGSHLYRRPLE